MGEWANEQIWYKCGCDNIVCTYDYCCSCSCSCSCSCCNREKNYLQTFFATIYKMFSSFFRSVFLLFLCLYWIKQIEVSARFYIISSDRIILWFSLSFIALVCIQTTEIHQTTRHFCCCCSIKYVNPCMKVQRSKIQRKRSHIWFHDCYWTIRMEHATGLSQLKKCHQKNTVLKWVFH